MSSGPLCFILLSHETDPVRSRMRPPQFVHDNRTQVKESHPKFSRALSRIAGSWPGIRGTRRKDPLGPQRDRRIPIEVIERFQPHEESAGAARRFVASSLVDWGRVREVDVVVLLTSEVVTNVVRHAGPHASGEEIAVALSRIGDRVRVSVTDNHAGIPTVGDVAPYEPSGRGLLLLDALADSWGVTTIAPGKVVWFEVGTEEALQSR